MEQWHKDFVVTSISGLLRTVVGHPLDTLKCRLQSNPHVYSGLVSGVHLILKKEGVKGLFKGLYTPLSYGIPINVLIFGEYYRANRQFERHYPTYKGLKYFLCGCWAALLGLIVSLPFEMTKCIQQADANKVQKCVPILKELYRTSGMKGLYRGFWSSFNRDVFSFGLYFYTFYTIKDYLDSKNKTTSFKLFILGGISGMISWIPFYPFDTIRANIQINKEYHHMTQYMAYKELTRKGGHSILFKGIGPTLIRSFIMNGVTLYVNEKGREMLEKF